MVQFTVATHILALKRKAQKFQKSLFATGKRLQKRTDMDML